MALHLTTGSPGSTTTVTAAGDVDLVSAPRLEAFVLGEAARTTGPIVLDLRGLTFFGAAGANTLVQLDRRLAAQQQRPAILCSSACVGRVLAMLGLDEVLDVRLPDALAEA